MLRRYTNFIRHSRLCFNMQKMDSSKYVGAGIGLGIAFGATFGKVFGNVGMGITWGIIIGASVGTILVILRRIMKYE